MYRRLATALLVGLTTAAAWAQSPDPFAAIHHQLTATADSLLAATDSADEFASRTSVRFTRREAQNESSPPVHWRVAVAPGAASPVGTADEWRGFKPHFTSLDGMRRWRPIVEPILAQEGVPLQLTAVALVESGGDPAALSPKGARGLWQFMPETARRYGLAVDGARDERLDVLKSTRAAARYLRDLHTRFGDWRLAFAAYNAGAGAVERASRRTGSSEFSLLESHLPGETRSYVPEVMAAMHSAGASPSTAPVRIVFASANQNPNPGKDMQ